MRWAWLAGTVMGLAAWAPPTAAQQTYVQQQQVTLQGQAPATQQALTQAQARRLGLGLTPEQVFLQQQLAAQALANAQRQGISSQEVLAQAQAQSQGASALSAAAQRRQLDLQRYCLLLLYGNQAANVVGLRPPWETDSLVDQYYTNGAAATAVPTTGPEAAYFSQGAEVTTVPTETFPLITDPSLGAGSFSDMSQGAVSPPPAPLPSAALPPPSPSAAPVTPSAGAGSAPTTP